MVVYGLSTSTTDLIGLRFSSNRRKFGTLQRDLPPLKDAVDYQLTKVPALYLFIERFREWVNWDKRVYLSFVRREDIVLDVGANVGAHTVFLSHVVGPHGQVLAFEPLPENVVALKETARRRARHANISILPVAVGDSKLSQRTVTLKVPGDDHTQASLAVQTAGSWEGKDFVEVEVPLVSLDTSSEVRSLPHLDFVKIDVEGAELDVMRGASRMLAQHLPLVYCEAYEKWQTTFGYDSADLIKVARSLGYVGARVFSGGRVHPMQLDRPPAPGLFTTSADILFFAEKHRRAVNVFDRRYDVHASSR